VADVAPPGYTVAVQAPPGLPYYYLVDDPRNIANRSTHRTSAVRDITPCAWAYRRTSLGGGALGRACTLCRHEHGDGR